MPFIKFTTTVNSLGGSTRELNFVNADKVTEAIYNEQDGTLKLFFGEHPGGRGHEYRLSGDEAKQALAVLQKL